MKLSVVIPAYNEAESLPETITQIHAVLLNYKIPNEILVINDNSSDNTLEILSGLEKDFDTLRYITNKGPNGFGYAIRKGLENFTGDIVAIMMADLSDSVDDLVTYYHTLINKKRLMQFLEAGLSKEGISLITHALKRSSTGFQIP